MSVAAKTRHRADRDSLSHDRIMKLWSTRPDRFHSDGGRLMSLSGHLEELRRKHQTLSEAVEAAQRSPGCDDLEIARMKKQKLIIKEEITRLSAH